MTSDSTLILQKAYVAGVAQAEREEERDSNNREWLKELADSQQHISRGVVVVRLKKKKRKKKKKRHSQDKLAKCWFG